MLLALERKEVSQEPWAGAGLWRQEEAKKQVHPESPGRNLP